MQRDTGTGDVVAQQWINRAIAEVNRVRQEDPTLEDEAVADRVRAWLFSQPGEKFNPLLDFPGVWTVSLRATEILSLFVGLDITQHTPVDILHTFLLGIVKYIWQCLHASWSKAQMDTFVVRLESTDIGGLNCPPMLAAYMMQYKDALIGKHYKRLVQTWAFHLSALASPSQLQLVRTAGELGAVLWIHKIEDMKPHTVRNWHACSQRSAANINIGRCRYSCRKLPRRFWRLGCKRCSESAEDTPSDSCVRRHATVRPPHAHFR
jgi:hypothetical protein